MSDTPNDPFTSYAAQAVQLHEIYISYRSAGFTENQSMQLLCTILSSTLYSPGEED